MSEREPTQEEWVEPITRGELVHVLVALQGVAVGLFGMISELQPRDAPELNKRMRTYSEAFDRLGEAIDRTAKWGSTDD